jgi:hypothetical protein
MEIHMYLEKGFTSYLQYLHEPVVCVLACNLKLALVDTGTTVLEGGREGIETADLAHGVRWRQIHFHVRTGNYSSSFVHFTCVYGIFWAASKEDLSRSPD